MITQITAGQRLDRYELLAPVAQGGMASVWVSRLSGRHGFEKLFAIKTILPQYAGDLQFRQMFLDEARLASRIEHDNVARVLDLGEQDGILYLVMEWVDSESLSRIHRIARAAGSAIPDAIALRIVADACAGLHAAHELCDRSGNLLGVVHRDVSPQNVLVAASGSAKVIDFGIAKARDRSAPDTSTGSVKGKYLYMSPEQALGRKVDRRADVWALGAMLYELLEGRAPFHGENQLVTLSLLTSGQPPPPLREDLHPSITAAISGALASNLSARFATADELGCALERAADEARLRASHNDVARFVSKVAGERLAARRQAVEGALAAANARARDVEAPAVAPLATPRVEVATVVERPVTPAAAAASAIDYPPPRQSRAPLILAGAAAVAVAGAVAAFATRTPEARDVPAPPSSAAAAPPTASSAAPVVSAVASAASSATASAASSATVKRVKSPPQPATTTTPAKTVTAKPKPGSDLGF